MVTHGGRGQGLAPCQLCGAQSLKETSELLVRGQFDSWEDQPAGDKEEGLLGKGDTAW